MSSIKPDFAQFRTLASGCNRVPVVATLICDELTPVSAFARLKRGAARAFLLESVIGGEKIARYSFLGAGPAVTFSATRERVRVARGRRPGVGGGADGITESRADDPLGVLETLLNEYRVATIGGLPRFLGGAVGYAAYDAVRYVERLPGAPSDDRQLPDLLFDIYDEIVVFDHVHKLVLAVAHADVSDPERPLRSSYQDAIDRIDVTIARLSLPLEMAPVRVALPSPPLERFTSSFERRDFERAVERSKEYIRAGDIFQVVLSQRLEIETAADPFDIYRSLRVINPSPFMFYLESPEVTLVGASPEIMCRVSDGIVTNRPLAGTRHRGATEAEDRRLREDLLADPKERAEHVMLVDLGRNDVGRVAEPGSVALSDVMSVEYYSHVMHICTNVTGRLADGRTAFDALRAAMPVGTVSGAPKVRALQIIDELEPFRRGPYAGAVGYVDFAGNMDTCIALRTLVIVPRPDGGVRAFVQVGAGIVADSVPAREYEETLNKAKGLLSAIGVAEKYFRARPASSAR